MIYQRVNMMS